MKSIKKPAKPSLAARIPDAELDIMLILWKNGGQTKEEGVYAPSRIIDVYNGLRSVRPCTRSAIHSLLERLASRGFVKIELTEGPTPYKLITPLVSEAEYRAAESLNFLEKLCRGSWKPLIAALIDAGEITDSDIEEISAMLNGKNAGGGIKGGAK